MLRALACVTTALVAGGVNATGAVVRVSAGLEGHAKREVCVPIALDVETDAKPLEATLHLREKNGRTRWELPLSAAAHARRELEVTTCPSPWAEGLEWSLDGARWADLTLQWWLPATPVVAFVTSTGTEIPGLRDVASTQKGPVQGGPAAESVALEPDDLPETPAALQSADVFVIDGQVASSITAPAWSALRDRVLVGATMVVHGAEPADVPESLLAGRWDAPSHVQLLVGDTRLPARRIAPIGSGAPTGGPALEECTCAAWRRVGLGHVFTVGLDLRAAAAHGAWGVTEWDLLFAPADSLGVLAVRPSPGDGWSTLEAPLASRLGRTRRPRTIAAMALLLVGLGVVAAPLTSKPGRGRLATQARVAALAGAVALPGFVLGAFVRHGAGRDEGLVVEERFPDARRKRVWRYVPASRGRTALPGEVGVPRAASWVEGLASEVRPVSRWRLGDRPSAEAVQEIPMTRTFFRTETWEDVVADLDDEQNDALLTFEEGIASWGHAGGPDEQRELLTQVHQEWAHGWWSRDLALASRASRPGDPARIVVVYRPGGTP